MRHPGLQRIRKTIVPLANTLAVPLAVLMTAMAFSTAAMAVEPAVREKIAAIGARAAGSNTNFATVACHAPAADVAGYTDRARKKFAADDAFDAHFVVGQTDGAQLAKKWIAMAAADSNAQVNLDDQCKTSLENMKTR